MSELGKLWYTLGLDTKDFDSTIKSLKDKIQDLQGKSVSINADSATTALGRVEELQKALNKLKDEVSLSVTGVPKTLEGGTANYNAQIVNLDAIRTEVENALKNLAASIDVNAIKTQLANVPSLKIDVTASQSTIQGVIKKIKDLLNINKVSIKVSPDWSKSAITKLQNDLQKQIKNIDLKDIKVTIDKSKIQEELNKGSYRIKVDVDVNREGLSEKVSSAVSQNANLRTGDTSRHTAEIREQNKHLTDQLGVRRAINDQMAKSTQIATMLGNAFGNVFAAYQLKNFLEGLIEIGGEIQKQRLALGHILKSEENAMTLFSQMKDLAVKSPFGLLDLMKNVRQLSAFGVEYNNLYDTMKRLSDVAAGLGIEFSRISLAYGETLERGFLDGKLVRMFAYQGIPVLQKVAEYYTEIKKNGKDIYNAADVRKMVSNREVGFEDLDAVIKRMTDEGGQFANMQEVMAESVAGKWKNVKDAYDIMLSDITEGNSQLLKAPAEILIALTRNYDAFVNVLGLVTVAILGLKGAESMYISTLGAESAAQFKEMQAEQARARSLAMQNAVANDASFAEMKRAAAMRYVSAEQIKQMLNEGKLTSVQARSLAMKLSLIRADKETAIANANYLRSLNLISDRYGMMIANGGKWKRFLGGVGANLQLLSIQAKQTAASFVAMSTAMLTNPMTWLFAGMSAFMAWRQHTNKIEEQLDRITERAKEAKDEILKGSIEIQERTRGINVDTADRGTLTTLIDDMTEFLKDKSANAPSILASVFSKDKDGKYIKDLKQQFNELKDAIDDMYNYANGKMEFAEEIGKALDFADGWFDESPLENAKDFLESQANFSKTIASAVMRNSDAATQAFDSLRVTYRDKLLEVFNVDDVSKISEAQLRTLIVKNKTMLDTFLKEFDKLRTDGLKLVGSVGYEAYKSDYDTMMKDILSTIIRAKRELEKLYSSNGKPLDWNSRDVQTQWNQEVMQTIQVKYGDENAQKATELISALMRDPKIFANAKLDANVTNADQAAQKLLDDGDIYKYVWLMPQTVPETKNHDPYVDLFGIDAKGAGNYVEAIENVEKKAKEHWSNLFRLQKEKKIKIKQLADGTYSITNIGKDADGQYFKDAYDDVHALNEEIRNAKKEGISLDYLTNKTGKPKETKKDTLLETWKEQFDELKKSFSEFQKWAKVVGNDRAIEEVNKIIDFSQFKKYGIKEGDLFDEKSFKVAIEKFYNSIAKQFNTTQRKKFGNNVKVEISNVDFTGTQKVAQELARNMQEEINTAMKQFDVYKSWFKATGDKQLSLDVAFNIKPIETEESKYFYNDLVKKLEAEVKRGTINELELGNLLNFENKSASAEMLYDKAGMQQYYSLWQKVKELQVSAGYEYAKSTAEALKNMMTFEQKIATIEEERRKALIAVKGNAEETAKVNTYYDSKIAELDPQYKQYISNVTTMTKDAARSMADAIKLRLTNELQMGAKSIEEYSKAIETVDAQLEKSERRINSYGEAWLLGKTAEYAKTRYNNAVFNEGQMRKLVESTSKAVIKAQDALANDQTPENYSALAEAMAKNTDAEEKLKKATIELQKALGLYTKEQEDANNKTLFDAMTSKVNTFINGLSNLADSLSVFGDSMTTFKEVTSVASTAMNRSSQFGEFGKMLGNSGGIVGSIVGAFIGVSEGLVSAMKNLMQKEHEDAMRIVNEVGRVRDTLRESLEHSVGKLYTQGLDEATRKQLVDLFNKYTRTTEVDEGYRKVIVTDTSYVGQKAKEALDSNSYFKAQIAFMEEQKKILEQQKTSMDMSSDKSYDEQVYQDTLDQIHNIKQEMKYLAEDMAKELYDIDFNSYATTLTDAIVGAWRKGEDAVEAYGNAVNDILANVAKSVVSQKIIGDFLDGEMIEGWLKDFANAGGIMDDNLFNGLNGIFSELENKIGESERFMDAWQEISERYGYSLKDAEATSSASNSIKGITEETADILASYINGIRLDLSIQRLAVEQIRDAIGGIDGTSISAIAQSQLTQLQNIAEYTLRTASAVEALRDNFVDVTTGAKQLSIQ